jgi:predicted nucleic acid-binding protein
MILVDTSVWIDFFRGINSRQRKLLHRLLEDDEDICLTEIVLTGILQGIAPSNIWESGIAQSGGRKHK